VSPYTIDLARILHQLLPDDAAEGSISTLPFGWRTRFPDGTGPAEEAMHRTAEGLRDLADRFGRPVRLALEPEPGCVVETAAGAVAALAELDEREWLGLCLDACHLATQFEDASVLDQCAAHAVRVPKAQVSNALRVTGEDRSWLSDFDEPRFLHQIRQRDGYGEDDLNPTTGERFDPRQEWRVHYHLPLDRTERTTQSELRATLAALVGGPTARTTHLDVETYTWSVLPSAGASVDLKTGIAAELAWAAEQLVELGLEPLG